jgi:hypothetical protein
VAPGTSGISAGVGRSRARRMTWQNVQRWVREVATGNMAKTAASAGAGLQGPLSAVREGFMCPASHRATAAQDVLIHILGNAASGALGRGFWGRGRLLWALYASTSDAT